MDRDDYVRSIVDEAPPLTDDQRSEIRRIVRESREAQGLPPTINDPSILATVAGMLKQPGTRVSEPLEEL